MNRTVFRYEPFVEKHLQVVVRSGAEFMCRCPFHEDGNASFQINVDKGLYVCFAGTCGEKGSIRSLQRHLGLSYIEEAMDVADIKARLDALRAPQTDALPVLPESHLARYAIPTDYWASRGFTPETVAAFDLGYDPMNDLVTIPIRDMQGGLLGVIKRYLDPDAELRYRYPKGFKRASNLFGSWLVAEDEEADTVVLCEGSLDAIKVWQAGFAGMAVYGSSLSPSQVRVLRRLGVGQVILAFDNDKAGRKAADSCLGWHEHKRGGLLKRQYDPATDLSREFLVRRVRYTRGMPSDPGAMDSDQIEDLLQRSKRV